MRLLILLSSLLFLAPTPSRAQKHEGPLEEALTLARTLADSSGRLRELVNVARAAEETTNHRLALACLIDAKDSYRHSEGSSVCDVTRLRCIEDIVSGFVSLGYKQEAREALGLSQQCLAQQSNQYTRLSGMVGVAFQYLAIADTEDAVKLADQVLTLHNASFKPRDYSSTSADDDLLRLLIALRLFNQADRAIDSISNPYEKVKVIGFAAVRLFEKRDTSLALHYLSRMHEQADTLQDEPFVVPSSMASVAQELFDISEAKFAFEVLSHARHIAIEKEDTFSLQEIAAAYAYVGKINDAMSLVPSCGDATEQIQLLIRISYSSAADHHGRI